MLPFVEDLSGKTCLVTGATAGIGRATVRGLLERGATVYFTGRSAAKAEPVAESLRRELPGARLQALELELGDVASVRTCAAAFLARDEPLHVLINNAGVAGHRGLTPSGFELAFGTNHVGHFLLSELLLERIRQSAPARIVNVSSQAHFDAKTIDFEAVRRPTRSISGMPEYSVSKLANLLHAQELARRLQGSGVTSYALHPGVVASDIWRRVPWPVRPLIKARMRSPEDGARTSLYCGCAPELIHESGNYYDDCRRTEPSRHATRALAAELWDRSAEWVGAGARTAGRL